MELRNYDQWLEQPYQDKENKAMEEEYFYNQMRDDWTISDVLDRLTPMELEKVKMLIIDTEELFNSLYRRAK